MAGRRTNLALLALLLLAFVTGVASWIVGPGLVRWIVIAHGIVGLSIVALAPWKSTIARRGLRRRRPGRGTAIAFAALIVTSTVAALVHVTGRRRVGRDLVTVGDPCRDGGRRDRCRRPTCRAATGTPQCDRPLTEEPAPERSRPGRRGGRLVGARLRASSRGRPRSVSTGHRLVRGRLRRPGGHAGHAMAQRSGAGGGCGVVESAHVGRCAHVLRR